jgi:hypothetical protein
VQLCSVPVTMSTVEPDGNASGAQGLWLLCACIFLCDCLTDWYVCVLYLHLSDVVQ